MSQRRTLILVAAVVIGALASFLVWNYVGNVEDDALNDAELVSAYLVKEEVPRGTSGQVAAASIVEEKIPRKFRPANAINSLDEIQGQVARGDLVANQVVVQGMFVPAGDPEAQLSFADKLEKIQNVDQVTYTLETDDIRGVAGLIQPGDYVNVMVKETTADGANPDDAAAGAAPGADQGSARYLYQKVLVLAVDYLTVGDSNGATAVGAGDDAGATAGGSPVRKGLITFIVPAKAAQVLASVPLESIYLSLVSKDYEPVPQGPVDLNPLPAESEAELTPYGPDGARSSD